LGHGSLDWAAIGTSRHAEEGVVAAGVKDMVKSYFDAGRKKRLQCGVDGKENGERIR